MKKSKSRFLNPHGGYRRHTQEHKTKQNKVLEEMERDLQIQIEEHLKAMEEIENFENLTD